MPLHIPDRYTTYRVMGIDPGLNFTGVASLDVSYVTRKILNIEAFTLANDRLADYTGLDHDTIAERTVKLYKLKQALQYTLERYNPSFIACEAPFYNRLRPMAFGALLEVVSVLHSAVLEYNSNIGFITVAPMSVKKVIGARMVKNDTEKGKLVVKEAIKNTPEIMDVLQGNIDTLSEHAIDAIAIGFTLINSD